MCLVDDVDCAENIIRNDERKEVHEALNSLSERDRIIAEMYFGFYDDRCFTQEEIASEFGISQSYVSRRIGAISKVLKKEIKKYNV